MCRGLGKSEGGRDRGGEEEEEGSKEDEEKRFFTKNTEHTKSTEKRDKGKGVNSKGSKIFFGGGEDVGGAGKRQ